MKINHSINRIGDFSIGDPRRSAESGVEKSRKNGGSSGNVQLSAASVSLQALVQQSSEGVFDSAKVEEIKGAIARGHFHVNCEKIADGLLAQVADLLRSQTSRT